MAILIESTTLVKDLPTDESINGRVVVGFAGRTGIIHNQRFDLVHVIGSGYQKESVFDIDWEDGSRYFSMEQAVASWVVMEVL